MYKVLIIEDDPMVLSINKRFVEKLSEFVVIETLKRENESLDKFIELEPDLVLLDVFMPEKNGLDLLREIRTAQIHSEVIMITAAQDVDTVSEAFRLGALDYIIKPYNFTRLKQGLEAFLLKMNTIKDTNTFTQSEIDRMKFSIKAAKEKVSSNKEEELPKGLDKFTLDKIKQEMENIKEPVSSSDMAKMLRLSRITVRKYLEYLVEVRMVEVQLKYGGSGRPTRLYCSSNKN